MKLFLVVLGGRCRGCHTEQHDVRWVVGDSIEETTPQLIQQWIGLRRGLHLDSYRTVERVDNHRVEVIPGVAATDQAGTDLRLWFVNLGAYEPNSMAERHHFGLVVARSTAAAKATAKRRWLKGLDQIHKDDLHGVMQEPELDDLLPLDGNGQWHLRLTPLNEGVDPPESPDWYGYRLL